LLTIADLSILEAELEIDETDIPDVRLGQVAEISIDALPARTYRGRVTEIGNSPILETGQASGQATNFKVVVTLDEDVVGVRPGFTCTADITTATRTDALAVPIQATTVREFRLDADGQIIREVRTGNAGSGDGGQDARDSDRDDMEEVEGVFLIRQSHAEFTPVVTGIAGERYFEALSGLEESDVVVTGPFAVVRTLEDGDEVRLNEPTSDR
jgi:HlyD family secretion protein